MLSVAARAGRLTGMKQSQLMTMGTIVVVAIILAAAIVIPRLGGGAATAAEFDYDSQPVSGSRDAPVKVAVFFDFLCPHCATFSETVTPVLEREFVDDGTAAIYFLNFPVIDAVLSRNLAMLGECVQRQGNDGFVAIEPVFLRSQQTFAQLRTAQAMTDHGIELASQFVPGIDTTALRTCVEEAQTGDEVDADVTTARQNGVTGTPSVFVDGVQVSNPTLANIRTAIQNAAN